MRRNILKSTTKSLFLSNEDCSNIVLTYAKIFYIERGFLVLIPRISVNNMKQDIAESVGDKIICHSIVRKLKMVEITRTLGWNICEIVNSSDYNLLQILNNIKSIREIENSKNVHCQYKNGTNQGYFKCEINFEGFLIVMKRYNFISHLGDLLTRMRELRILYSSSIANKYALRFVSIIPNVPTFLDAGRHDERNDIELNFIDNNHDEKIENNLENVGKDSDYRGNYMDHSEVRMDSNASGFSSNLFPNCGKIIQVKGEFATKSSFEGMQTGSSLVFYIHPCGYPAITLKGENIKELKTYVDLTDNPISYMKMCEGKMQVHFRNPVPFSIWKNLTGLAFQRNDNGDQLPLVVLKQNLRVQISCVVDLFYDWSNFLISVSYQNNIDVSRWKFSEVEREDEKFKIVFDVDAISYYRLNEKNFKLTLNGEPIQISVITNPYAEDLEHFI